MTSPGTKLASVHKIFLKSVQNWHPKAGTEIPYKGEFLWNRAFVFDIPSNSTVPKLNFDGYLTSEFLLPPKPSQRFMLHYTHRLHSGCSAWTNKCSALCCCHQRDAGGLVLLHCRQPGLRQLPSPLRAVSWAQLSQPTHTTGQCWRCWNLGFPPHVAPRPPQDTLAVSTRLMWRKTRTQEQV